MKKDQKPSSNLRDLLGIKEPSDRGGKKPILKKTHFTIWYFVIAILIGRGARYLVLGLLAVAYGEQALAYAEAHSFEVAMVVIGLLAAGVAGYFVWTKVQGAKRR